MNIPNDQICIKKVIIHGFFSFYKFELDLNQENNIIVGTNGVGKSNFLKIINTTLTLACSITPNMSLFNSFIKTSFNSTNFNNLNIQNSNNLHNIITERNILYDNFENYDSENKIDNNSYLKLAENIINKLPNENLLNNNDNIKSYNDETYIEITIMLSTRDKKILSTYFILQIIVNYYKKFGKLLEKKNIKTINNKLIHEKLFDFIYIILKKNLYPILYLNYLKLSCDNINEKIDSYNENCDNVNDYNYSDCDINKILLSSIYKDDYLFLLSSDNKINFNVSTNISKFIKTYILDKIIYIDGNYVYNSMDNYKIIFNSLISQNKDYQNIDSFKKIIKKYKYFPIINPFYDTDIHFRIKNELFKMKKTKNENFLIIKKKFYDITGKNFNIIINDSPIENEFVIYSHKHQRAVDKINEFNNPEYLNILNEKLSNQQNCTFYCDYIIEETNGLCSHGETELIVFLTLFYNNNGSNKILLVDEPCRNLSSQNKMNFRKFILENENINQKIIVTHDIELINEKTCNDLIMFDIKNNLTKYNKIPDRFQTSFGKIKELYEHREIFFSKKCLIVEGYSDYRMLKQFLNIINNDEYIIINTNGCESELPLRLNELDIQYKIIYDIDKIAYKSRDDRTLHNLKKQDIIKIIRLINDMEIKPKTILIILNNSAFFKLNNNNNNNNIFIENMIIKENNIFEANNFKHLLINILINCVLMENNIFNISDMKSFINILLTNKLKNITFKKLCRHFDNIIKSTGDPYMDDNNNQKIMDFLLEIIIIIDPTINDELDKFDKNKDFDGCINYIKTFNNNIFFWNSHIIDIEGCLFDITHDHNFLNSKKKSKIWSKYSDYKIYLCLKTYMDLNANNNNILLELKNFLNN